MARARPQAQQTIVGHHITRMNVEKDNRIDTEIKYNVSNGVDVFEQVLKRFATRDEINEYAVSQYPTVLSRLRYDELTQAYESLKRGNATSVATPRLQYSTETQWLTYAYQRCSNEQWTGVPPVSHILAERSDADIAVLLGGGATAGDVAAWRQAADGVTSAYRNYIDNHGPGKNLPIYQL